MIMAYTAEEYYAMRDQALDLANRFAERSLTVRELTEEVEILRAERSHWYHMYNNNLDERPDI